MSRKFYYNITPYTFIVPWEHIDIVFKKSNDFHKFMFLTEAAAFISTQDKTTNDLFLVRISGNPPYNEEGNHFVTSIHTVHNLFTRWCAPLGDNSSGVEIRIWVVPPREYMPYVWSPEY